LHPSDSIDLWQARSRKPGELVGVWNHEKNQESAGIVVEEFLEDAWGSVRIQGESKDRYGVRTVLVVVNSSVERLFWFEIFPLGYAYPPVPH